MNLSVARLPRKPYDVMVGGGPDSVQSVNGMTGHIVLDATDVGLALPMCVHDGTCWPPRPNAPVVLYFGPWPGPTDARDNDWFFPS